MHVVVYGAGGVGGYFGARLLGGGAHVSFVARGAHLEEIRSQGLRIESAIGDALVHPAAASDDPATLAPADVVLFAVKLPDVAAAIEALPLLVGPQTVVLPLQNGIEVSDLLAAKLGPAPVALGVAFIGATIAAPGVIRHVGELARLRFGALQPHQVPALQRLLDACTSARIDAKIIDDIGRLAWEKFVFLVALSGLTTLARQPIGVVRTDPALRALLAESMDEVAALARASGAPLPDDFVARQMAFVDTLPAGQKASMLHDLEAGRPLELPWLSGAVVRLAAARGLAAPVNRVIAAALGPYAADRAPRP
jgi:2-dehydropantoate 2-reductase